MRAHRRSRSRHLAAEHGAASTRDSVEDALRAVHHDRARDALRAMHAVVHAVELLLLLILC